MTPSADSSQIGPASDSTCVMPGPSYGVGTDRAVAGRAVSGPLFAGHRCTIVISFLSRRSMGAPTRSDPGGIGQPIVPPNRIVTPGEGPPGQAVDGHRRRLPVEERAEQGGDVVTLVQLDPVLEAQHRDPHLG